MSDSEEVEVGRPVCGQPRKRGGLCQSTAIGEDGRCVAHREGTDMAAIGRAGGLVSGEIRREQAKTGRQRLAEKADEEFDTVWGSFKGAMTATMPVSVSGDGDEQVVVTVPDWRLRYMAATELLNQVYGRPPQAIGLQVAGRGGSPLELRITDETLRAGLEILDHAGGVDESDDDEPELR